MKYISKYEKLRLISKHSFKREVNGEVLIEPSKFIQFVDGVYDTDDKDEIKFLEGHANFGNAFIKADKNALKERAEMKKSLDDREKELDEREKDVKKKEMDSKGKEEGSKPSAKGIKGTEKSKY